MFGWQSLCLSGSVYNRIAKELPQRDQKSLTIIAIFRMIFLHVGRPGEHHDAIWLQSRPVKIIPSPCSIRIDDCLLSRHGFLSRTRCTSAFLTENFNSGLQVSIHVPFG
jgi:hypothetical protein